MNILAFDTCFGAVSVAVRWRSARGRWLLREAYEVRETRPRRAADADDRRGDGGGGAGIRRYRPHRRDRSARAASPACAWALPRRAGWPWRRAGRWWRDQPGGHGASRRRAAGPRRRPAAGGGSRCTARHGLFPAIRCASARTRPPALLPPAEAGARLGTRRPWSSSARRLPPSPLPQPRGRHTPRHALPTCSRMRARWRMLAAGSDAARSRRAALPEAARRQAPGRQLPAASTHDRHERHAERLSSTSACCGRRPSMPRSSPGCMPACSRRPGTRPASRSCSRIPAPPRSGTRRRTAADAGFILGQLAADEAEILTLGVRKDMQRRGIGRRLVGGLARAAKKAEARRLFLEVGPGNAAALALYKAHGLPGDRRAQGLLRARRARRPRTPLRLALAL